MPEVFIGAGSNIEPRRHLGAALRALAERFGILRLSPVYRNSPVGEVAAALGAIEAANGRTRTEAKFAPRTLDLDLLLYGDFVGEADGVELPRDEITRYSFVLRPLADLAGERLHPALGQSFAQLWESFDSAKHPLTRVEGDFAAEVAL